MLKRLSLKIKIVLLAVVMAAALMVLGLISAIKFASLSETTQARMVQIEQQVDVLKSI